MTAQAAIERQPIDIGQVPAKKILRRTTGSCPTCLETVPASVVEDGGAVYLVKECPTDGDSRTMLSQHADYYSPLMDYFFDIVPAHLPQRDYILRLTSKCNMACPICLAWANESKEEDLPVESIKNSSPDANA
ncbi:MAG: hypothetical protein M5R36_24575 [Deltaproteobacteria bacterium]|nr:hypothetical protein [Deltaproteobacteria bacterium]